MQPYNESEIEEAVFEEAETLIDQAEAESAPQPDNRVEYVAADDPLQSAKGLVRAVLGGFNWLLGFKEPRVQWGEEVFQKAENDIAPALVKHGVGSGGIGRYGEEAAAVGCLVHLGWTTRAAIIELRELDAAEAKKAKGGDRGQES